MDITYDNLADTYSRKSTDELLVLHAGGHLTDMAYSALEATLAERGVVPPPRPAHDPHNIGENSQDKSTKFVFPVVIVLILWLAWAAWNGSARKERLEQAVDHAMIEARDVAMQKYLDGEILSSLEFIQIAVDIVQATNSKLPIRIDNSTTLESISIRHGVLRYGYTLDSDASNGLDAQNFARVMRDDLISSACVEPLARSALVNEIALVFSYKLSTGEHLTDVTLAKNDCSLIWGDEP